MGNQKKILLNGLRKSDEIVFSSLFSLLPSSGKQQWLVITEGTCDVAVIDVDTPNGPLMARHMEQQGTKVIRLTTEMSSNQTGLWVHKPVRSSEIIRCISELNKSSGNHESRDSLIAHETNLIRLRRWPTQQTIKSFSGSKRLCAILISKSMSISKAATLAGLDYNGVLKFVERCHEERCVQVLFQQEASKIARDRSSPKTHSKLFSMLRQKLKSGT